ncbi:MAG TPA: MBG domain-containing protein [Pyrinomonadaceae bacterium]|nr:MBG domain-containing protein [Pyrinomonadaceae bacterium]
MAAQDQDRIDPGVTPQKRTVPVVTMANAPDVPQCREILNQDILDVVNTSEEDPGETFEANRRAHPHMIEMPPTTECASEIWQEVRNPERAPAIPELINSRQYSFDSVYSLNALAASIGTNTDPSSGVEGYQGENSISINPNNPQQMIAHSNTFFRDTTAQCQSPTGGAALTFGTMALFGSSDGGQTWKYNCAPWHTAVTGGVTSANAYFGSDPALAWDANGNAYACYMLISQNSSGSSGASIVVAKSTDVGQSWQQLGSPVVNRIGVTTSLDDKEMMAIDTTSGQAHSFPGRIYVIWDEGNAERIAHSDDGTTWTTVTPTGNTTSIGGNLVIGPDGTVYAIWTHYNVETIVFSKSTDGGTTWTTPAVIATLALQSFGTNNLPPAQDTRGINGFGAIDVDKNPNSPFFGNLYVSFTDFPSGVTTGADLNAYLIRSTNGGTTWGTRVKVNDDNFGASQFFPWVAVDQSDGTVNMSWIDSRIDPLNRKTQAVYARSSDGGQSFEPNIPLDDNGASFVNNVNYSDENTTDNTSYNGNQYGDYTGIAALNRQVHPLWTDSRMFFPSADTHSPTRREDNATTVITNCSAPVTVNAPTVNSSTAPNVTVSWSAPAGWGTNATNGTYSVYRNTAPTFPGGTPLASGLTATSFVDTTGTPGTTYFYFVSAKNNCPGTALTPMSTSSSASAAVVFGSAGTATGILQGTVTSGGSALSGVVVSAGAYSATTNASGFYQIPGIGAGSYTVSASPAGYNAATINNVAVTDGATTTQDIALTPITSNNCFTDTAFGDFSTGSGTNADIAASPGDVRLSSSGGEAIDQNQTGATTISTTPTSTTWAGQTFTAGKTGNLTKISVGLGLNSGTTGTVTVEIHNASSNLPGSTVLSSVATLGPVTNASGTVATYTATFSSPAAVVSGTQYSIVVKGGTGSVYVVRSSGNPYSGGQYSSTANSGSSWTAASTADMTFTTYVTSPVTYQASGNFISSVKDSGAVVGSTANWGTLSWNNSALPSGTSIKFQAAASSSASGPFNFVGPDGTASTFFTSGASLSQFNGLRYLKYKALLATTVNTNTPTLNDVTVCVADQPSIVTTTLAAAPATGTYGGTVNLSATLTGNSVGVSGKTVTFTLNGNPVGSGTTDPSGVATVSNVSLAGINAGSYPNAIGASFAGDGGYTSSTSNATLNVNKASQTITFGTLNDKTYGDADFNVSASASSGLTVSFNASGNCTNTGNTIHITGAGSCTVTASQGGDTNYNAATDVPQSFNIAKAGTTTTVTVSNAGYDGQPHGGSANVTGAFNFSQNLTVTYFGRNGTTYAPTTTAPTNAGDYSAVANFAGDSNYAASSDSKDYSITKASQTITFGTLNDKTFGDPDFNVSASASSGLAVSFGASGNCSVNGNTVHITGAGSCIITASQAGDTNYNAATDVPQSFNIGKATATITLGGLSQTYDGTAKSATATTNPSGLSVTFTYAPTQQAQRVRSTVATSPVNAGSYTVTATINDPNYQGTASDTLVINKADANVSVTGYTGAYDGSSHGATGTATGAQNEDLSSLFDFGATYKNVPGGTAHWTFNSGNTNANYNSASGDAQIAISKATPVITWSNPADIVYGTALGAAQLNATANTPGAFTYTPAAGTVLASGNSQNLHVSFAPTDTTNYNNASKDVSINVLSAVLSVSMTADRNPAPVGMNFNYKATIANVGNAASTNTVLTDVLPSLVTFTAASASQGACSYNSTTRAVTCNVGSIPAGSSATVQITVKPRDEGTLDDTATVTAGQWDPATGNSSASVNGLQSIKLVDLSVSLTDSNDPIFVGDQTTYTMVVKNANTTINATGVSLQDALPSGMTFVAATTTQGSLVTPPVGSTGIVTANIGTVAPNATVTVTVTAKGATAGVQTSTASVSSTETDSNTSNNTATQSTTVKAVVVVGLQKVLLAKQVMTGGCENTTGNVYLTAPAPDGGVTVALSSNISGVTVPSSVFIPQGAMVSPAFNVTTSQVTAKQVGLVTATSGQNSVSRSVTINVGNGTCTP